VRGALVAYGVPALIGGVVLVVVDVVRGESAPWWLVGLIFVAVYAIWGAMLLLVRRRRT
jgi:uncharacterized membrane protein SirB2